MKTEFVLAEVNNEDGHATGPFKTHEEASAALRIVFDNIETPEGYSRDDDIISECEDGTPSHVVITFKCEDKDFENGNINEYRLLLAVLPIYKS